jgi:hypothetical protein
MFDFFDFGRNQLKGIEASVLLFIIDLCMDAKELLNLEELT